MKHLSKEVLQDVIGWDVESWWKFIPFIEDLGIDFTDKRVLEIGAGSGGMSIYSALQGAEVTCTDVQYRDGIFENHRKYHLEQDIMHRELAVNDLSKYYTDYFDIVIFKAVIGGIGRFNNGNQHEAVEEIYKSLKDGGYCIFADSMQATPIHALARKLFGSNWQYFTREEIMELFKNYTLVSERYFGFIAPFSRALGNHQQIRDVFGKADTLIFDRIIPEKYRYLGAFAFQKRELQENR